MASKFVYFALLVISVSLETSSSSPLFKGTLVDKQLLTIRYASGLNYTFHGEQPHRLPKEEPVYYCGDGVWITYPGEYYEDGPGGSIRVLSYLKNLCGPISDDKIGSVRFAGKSGANSAPFANVYTEEHFKGSAIPVDGGLKNLQRPIKSFITINTQIEVFELPEYQGNSLCIEVDPINCKNGVCVIWFWNSAAELPWGSDPKSVKSGCNVSKI